MAKNFRATAAKRQRELDQKDRVKDREARRTERRDRIQQRADAGHVGPPMGEPMPSLNDDTGPAPIVTPDDTAARPTDN